MTISLHNADRIILEHEGVEFSKSGTDRFNFNPYLNPTDFKSPHGWQEHGDGDLYDLAALDFEPKNWRSTSQENTHS